MKRQVYGLMVLKQQKNEENIHSQIVQIAFLVVKKEKFCFFVCFLRPMSVFYFHHLLKKVITVCMGRVCLLKCISMYVRVPCLSCRSLRLRNHLVLDPGKLLNQQLKIGCLFSKSTLLFVPFFLS